MNVRKCQPSTSPSPPLPKYWSSFELTARPTWPAWTQTWDPTWGKAFKRHVSYFLLVYKKQHVLLRDGESLYEKRKLKSFPFLFKLFLSELKENNGRYSTYYVHSFTENQYLKVLSSEMDPAEIMFIWQAFIVRALQRFRATSYSWQFGNKLPTRELNSSRCRG